MSAPLAAFIRAAFDREIRAAIATSALELHEQACGSASIATRTYTAAGVRYWICAVPGSKTEAVEQFQTQFGGLTRFIDDALEDESFRRDRCHTLAVLTCSAGSATAGEEGDASAWVSLSIAPRAAEDAPPIDLLSYELLSDEERAAIQPFVAPESSHSGLA